jgi:hypothetical protein
MLNAGFPFRPLVLMWSGPPTNCGVSCFGRVLEQRAVLALTILQLTFGAQAFNRVPGKLCGCLYQLQFLRPRFPRLPVVHSKGPSTTFHELRIGTLQQECRP